MAALTPNKRKNRGSIDSIESLDLNPIEKQRRINTTFEINEQEHFSDLPLILSMDDSSREPNSDDELFAISSVEARMQLHWQNIAANLNDLMALSNDISKLHVKYVQDIVQWGRMKIEHPANTDSCPTPYVNTTSCSAQTEPRAVTPPTGTSSTTAEVIATNLLPATVARDTATVATDAASNVDIATSPLADAAAVNVNVATRPSAYAAAAIAGPPSTTTVNHNAYGENVMEIENGCSTALPDVENNNTNFSADGCVFKRSYKLYLYELIDNTIRGQNNIESPCETYEQYDYCCRIMRLSFLILYIA